MSHIDCTEQVLLIWCATHCAGVPARQVFLAPDLDDSSHGGEANALSAPTPALNAAFVCSLLPLVLDSSVRTPWATRYYSHPLAGPSRHHRLCCGREHPCGRHRKWQSAMERNAVRAVFGRLHQRCTAMAKLCSWQLHTMRPPHVNHMPDVLLPAAIGCGRGNGHATAVLFLWLTAGPFRASVDLQQRWPNQRWALQPNERRGKPRCGVVFVVQRYVLV